MINTDKLLELFIKNLHLIFGEKIIFIGLQGSYARGEATENSDIDVVIILDKLTFENLKSYGNMLDSMPEKQLFCGFISGKEELEKWADYDIFQFYHDTIPIQGNLDFIKHRADKNAAKKAIHSGACNIYHACIHNFLHEKSGKILKHCYKAAIFVIQALIYHNKGIYLKTKKQLFNEADNAEKEIIKTAAETDNSDFEYASKILIEWSKNLILNYSE